MKTIPEPVVSGCIKYKSSAVWITLLDMKIHFIQEFCGGLCTGCPKKNLSATKLKVQQPKSESSFPKIKVELSRIEVIKLIKMMLGDI